MALSQVTVQVGDAEPGVALDELCDELAAHVHSEAQKYFGRQRRCWYRAYAGEQRGGRRRFEQDLRDLETPASALATYLAEWDESSRPVAIVHVGSSSIGDRRPWLN